MTLITAKQRDTNKETRAVRIKKRWVEEPFERFCHFEWQLKIFSDFIPFLWHRGLLWGFLLYKAVLQVFWTFSTGLRDLFGWFFNIWPFLLCHWQCHLYWFGGILFYRCALDPAAIINHFLFSQKQPAIDCPQVQVLDTHCQSWRIHPLTAFEWG